MSKRWNQILLAIILGAIIPSVIFAVWERYAPPAAMQEPENTEASEVTTTSPEEDPTQPMEGQQQTVNLPVLMSDGSVHELDMDAYLTAVILKEMPSEFEMEAMKAQAVACRTYTLFKMAKHKHDGAALCTDASCCQGYCTQEAYLEAGGTEETINKVQQAVAQTKDLVLTYDGKLIEATYFSCSGGKTEDAKAVWGTDVPYLQATDSPGEEEATHYTDTVTFSADEFSALLGDTLTGPSAGWLERVTYTDGGGVATMTLCGKTYQGTQLRQLLGLHSTAFVFTALGDTITITTKGFGHRVGMSQYGADAMAVAGSDFEQILAHYYKDTTLEQYDLTD